MCVVEVVLCSSKKEIKGQEGVSRRFYEQGPPDTSNIYIAITISGNFEASVSDTEGEGQAPIHENSNPTHDATHHTLSSTAACNPPMIPPDRVRHS